MKLSKQQIRKKMVKYGHLYAPYSIIIIIMIKQFLKKDGKQTHQPPKTGETQGTGATSFREAAPALTLRCPCPDYAGLYPRETQPI